jgi:hypothetical protein
MKVFTRYLLRSHIGPFFFAFGALTGVILINTIARQMADLERWQSSHGDVLDTCKESLGMLEQVHSTLIRDLTVCGRRAAAGVVMHAASAHA